MKRTILTLTILFLCLFVYAQDSITRPRILLRPYFEGGINFLRNDELKHNYSTQSMSVWGAGLQIGLSETSQMIPYLQYSYSSFGIRTKLTNNAFADSTLLIRQVAFGLFFPFKLVKDAHLRLRLGYTYSRIEESFYAVDDDAHGFQLGLGVEWKIFTVSRVYSDLIYNYQKTGRSRFSDFDMLKLSLGIAF